MFTNDGVFVHPHLTGKQQLNACHQVIGIISMLVLYSTCVSVCTSQTPHNHSTKCLSAMSLEVLLGAHDQQQAVFPWIQGYGRRKPKEDTANVLATLRRTPSIAG
jgi:hypothetical protein